MPVCLNFSSHYLNLCFFLLMGFVFCDSYYPTDGGGPAGGEGRAGKDRTGGKHGQGRTGRNEGHGRGKTGRGEARQVHYAPGSH